MNVNQKQSSTAQAVEVLKKGGVAVYPTETAYGLGADAANARAVERIFEIKGRAPAKSVLLLMKDVSMVKRYALVSAEELSLMKTYWPGALTIVLRVKPGMRPKLAQGVVAKDGSIAVRVSSNPVASALVKGLSKPLVSTSANRASGANTYSVAGVKKQLGASLRAARFPYYIYDAGAIPRRKVSTIVRLHKGGVEVLRRGEIIL
ncbi:MAG: threonylcarbamoyl-AMP synthase [Candidatus Magasanikbacteria bacterium]|nr:threonylcarbamoyl-AMP synthase [Candidatus Magasanikbacteria bacterium]